MDDGTLTPRERFDLIEKRLSDLEAQMERIEGKLDRILGAVLLAAAGIPIALFVAEKVIP